MSTSDTAAPSRPAADPAPTPNPTRAERVALWVATAGLIVLTVLQAPGRIVAETKLDVVVAPGAFLGRALSAWDPTAAFGRLQNQAVGYLFPMGPFSLAGHALGLPAWLTQRLWIAGLLVIGLWGAWRVARALGIASPGGRVAAGLAYTLAPATVATVAFQSAGQLPYAFAPWVLVPLLERERFRSPRRAAAASALAIVAMGGVNGAATLAVLPLVVTWFLTREPGPARRRLAGWWLAALVMATAWWVVALLVYVRYGARFTSYTETAAVTTSTESAVEVLRGTGNWIAYISTSGGRWLPGSWSLVSSRVAVVGSSALAALGIVGLARRDAPARRWLVPTAVLGAVALGLGHSGPLAGGFGPQLRTLLDGPLAPFRNVHKFSPVLRLPLAIGLGHVVSVAEARLATVRRGRSRAGAAVGRVGPPAAAVGACGLIVLSILPALPGRLVAPGSFASIPAYWQDTVRWLDAHPDGGRSLLLPGAAFGEYRWGRPLDEPLSALGHGAWATRDLVPLGGDGSTRLLDAVDRAVLSDAVPPGFVAALARAGVRHLVVRNDLDPTRSAAPSPRQVHRALASAPELRRVASFGPPIAAGGSADRLSASLGPGVAASWPAVEVYAVPDAAPRVEAYPASGALVASGGAEAMLAIPGAAVAGRAVVLDADVPPGLGLPGAVSATTDTARRRDLDFGTIRNNASYTLTATEPAPDTGRPPVDRLGFSPDDHLTLATSAGAAVTASSYPGGADRRPEHQPYAAFDGDPATAWTPGVEPRAQWVEARWTRPLTVTTVEVQVPVDEADRVSALDVATDAGHRLVAVPPGGRVVVHLPAGPTRRLRITISAVTALRDGDRSLGISEVVVPGLTVRRPLATPTDRPAGLAAGAAEVGWLTRSQADPFDSGRTDEDARLERTVNLRTSGARVVDGTARPVPGPALDALLAGATPAPGGGVALLGSSSTWRGVPALGPAAAADADRATSWVSDPGDAAPSLTLVAPQPRTVDEVVVVPTGPPLAPLTMVEVDTGSSTIRLRLPPSGRLRFPAVRTDTITLSFPGAIPPVGIAEAWAPAFGRPAPRATPPPVVALPCGRGPRLVVDGRAVATSASATVADLQALRPVHWATCQPLALAAGTHRIDAGPDRPLRISTLNYAPVGGLMAAHRPRTTRIERWGTAHRQVVVGPGAAALLATTENANAGWTATLAGHRLQPVRVDGWRQGWLLPAGAGGSLSLTYGPDRTQRLGLLVGLALVLALIALALVPDRRGRAGAPTTAGSPDRALPAGLLVGIAVLAGAVLGGPLVLLVLPLLALPRRPQAAPWLAGASVAVASAVVLWQPGRLAGSGQGAYSWAAQAAAVLAVLTLAVSALPSTWRPRVRRRHA